MTPFFARVLDRDALPAGAKPTERCYICGGAGRRSSFVLAMGAEIEGECPDCAGTGRLVLGVERVVEAPVDLGSSLGAGHEIRPCLAPMCVCGAWAVQDGRCQACIGRAADRLAELAREEL